MRRSGVQSLKREIEKTISSSQSLLRSWSSLSSSFSLKKSLFSKSSTPIITRGGKSVDDVITIGTKTQSRRLAASSSAQREEQSSQRKKRGVATLTNNCSASSSAQFSRRRRDIARRSHRITQTSAYAEHIRRRRLQPLCRVSRTK